MNTANRLKVSNTEMSYRTELNAILTPIQRRVCSLNGSSSKRIQRKDKGFTDDNISFEIAFTLCFRDNIRIQIKPNQN